MKKSAAATRLWSVGYFFIFTVVCAIQPEPPILGQGCALLKQHIIYCYGGATYTSDANNRHAKTHDTLYALDLQGTSTQVDSWRLVTPRGGSIGPNAAFAFAGLADDVHMIVHGGWGLNDGHTSLINQTGVFSAETENWEIIPMPKKTSPLSEMPAVLDMNKTVWIWSGQAAKGGDRESDVPEPENIRFFFNQQFVANRALFPANSYARLGHSAAFLAAEAAILYFGGLYAETEDRDIHGDGFQSAAMTEILIFYTRNQTWGIRPIASGVIPSARYFHTTTSVPGTSDIILYGGRAYGTDRPVDDFLYKYNCHTNLWTRVNLKTVGAGPRWGHTAILYQNNRLFILFGANSDGASTNDFYTLRIDLMQWEGGGRRPGAGGEPSDESYEGKIDGGAIFAVILGIFVSAALAAVALYFYNTKRKQQRKNISAGSRIYANDEPQGKDSLILAVPPKDEVLEHRKSSHRHHPESQHASMEAIHKATSILLYRILQHKPDVPPPAQSASEAFLGTISPSFHKPNQLD